MLFSKVHCKKVSDREKKYIRSGPRAPLQLSTQGSEETPRSGANIVRSQMGFGAIPFEFGRAHPGNGQGHIFDLMSFGPDSFAITRNIVSLDEGVRRPAQIVFFAPLDVYRKCTGFQRGPV